MKILILTFLIFASLASGENIELQQQQQQRFTSELIEAKKSGELTRVNELFYLEDLPKSIKETQLKVAQEIFDRPIENMAFIAPDYFDSQYHWNLPIRSAIRISFADRHMTGRYAHVLGYTLALGIHQGKIRIIECSLKDKEPPLKLELPISIEKNRNPTSRGSQFRYGYASTTSTTLDVH
ncbi:hypothetical protein ACWPKO_11535 [Coraliomargarita sp. W4R53]